MASCASNSRSCASQLCSKMPPTRHSTARHSTAQHEEVTGSTQLRLCSIARRLCYSNWVLVVPLTPRSPSTTRHSTANRGCTFQHPNYTTRPPGYLAQSSFLYLSTKGLVSRKNRSTSPPSSDIKYCRSQCQRGSRLMSAAPSCVGQRGGEERERDGSAAPGRECHDTR